MTDSWVGIWYSFFINPTFYANYHVELSSCDLDTCGAENPLKFGSKFRKIVKALQCMVSHVFEGAEFEYALTF